MAQWLNGRARRGIVCQHLCSIPNHALFLTALFNQCRLSPYGIRGLQLIIITNDLFNRPVLCHPWWSVDSIHVESMDYPHGFHEIIKIMVICGLSVDSPGLKNWIGYVHCQKKFHGIHGTSMESANPCGLHKDYLGSDKSSWYDWEHLWLCFCQYLAICYIMRAVMWKMSTYTVWHVT